MRKIWMIVLSTAIPLSSIFADAEKPFIYGFASGQGGIIQRALKWTTDQDGKNPSSVTPWTANSNDYRYVILSHSKFDRSSSFPDVPVYIGADGPQGKYKIGEKRTEYNSFNWNGYGVNLTFPQMHFLFGKILGNGTGLTNLKGNWTLLHDEEDPLDFYANAIEVNSTRGFNFAGKFISGPDVTAYLDGGAHRPQNETAQMGYASFKFTGDFSEYSGALCLRGMGTARPRYFDVCLESPTAMGCMNAPRDDAMHLFSSIRHI